MQKIETLRTILNSIIPIDDENWQLLLPHMKSVVIEEDEVLHKAGDICPFIAFIKKGALRAYYTNDEDIDTNLLLCAQYEFITDYESFITQSPSKLAIQATVPSEVIILPHDVLVSLYEFSFYWNKFGRKVAENVYLNCKKRTEELLFLSPEKRYLTLMEQQPDYFQKYPLKHLASYLGITPQSLSRIRARLTK